MTLYKLHENRLYSDFIGCNLILAGEESCIEFYMYKGAYFELSFTYMPLTNQYPWVD